MKRVFNLSLILFVLCGVFVASFSFASNPKQVYASTTIVDFSNSYNNESLPSGYCIRDNYMVYTENQADSSLCWAFASNKAASTTIMKATGEYVDFSESWISTALAYGEKYNPSITTASKYYSGDGGSFIYYNNVINEYGHVLEQDYEFEEGFIVSQENVDNYFNMYSQYATHNYVDNLVAGKFPRYYGKSNKTQIMNSMKLHIYKHGGISAGLRFENILEGEYKGKTIYYKEPSMDTKYGHSLTLIGWDDSITLTAPNNVTYKGAWIALNSWGNQINTLGDEGIIYIFYEDSNFDSYSFAYKYQECQDMLYNDSIESSTAEYKTILNGKYHTNFSGTEKDTEQRNIFFEQDSVNITYDYSLQDGATIKSIQIYKSGKECTKNFAIDQDSSFIYITGTNVEAGVYKVKILTTNGAVTEGHLNQFFVCDGTEINYLYYYYTDDTVVENNGRHQCYNTFYTEEEEIIVATTSASKKIFLGFIFSTYNTITKLKFETTEFDVTDNNIFVNHTFNLEQSSVFNIELITSSGTSSQIKLKVFLMDEENEVLANVYYDADGGDNSFNSKKLVVDKTDGAVLNNPTKKDNYIFDGWYYSNDFSESSKLVFDGSKYVLEYNKLIIETNPTLGDLTDYFNSYVVQMNSAFVYAKWKSIYQTVSFVTNGGTLVADMSVITGTKIEQPSTTKKGYNFIGWYKDSAFKTQWNFSLDTVTEDTILYAYFDLQSATNVNLTITKTSCCVGESVTLDISFNHEIKSDLSISIQWQKDGVAIATTTEASYSYTPDSNGDFVFTAVLTYVHDGNSKNATSNPVQLSACNLSQITIEYKGNCVFEIVDADSYNSTYNISLYKEGTLLSTFAQNNKTVNINQHMSNQGKYYISVQKTYKGQELDAVISIEIDVFKVRLYDNNNIYKTMLLEDGAILTEISQPLIPGYKFIKWIDGNNSEVVLPLTINANMDIYAELQIKELTVKEIENVNEVYLYNTDISIALNVSHELTNGEYSYKWFKVEDSSFVRTEKNLTLRYVKDSGNYYCTVTYKVDGHTLTAQTNPFSVEIEKQKTKIDYSLLANQIYTYNGTQQAINSGVNVTREDEIPEIIYSNNTFTNVPECGYITVCIIAEATENYEMSTQYVNVTINKALGIITVGNNNQTFVYNKQTIAPEFSINNIEQTVSLVNMPKFAGEYLDVELVAEESQNYKRAVANIGTITIQKAETTIDVSNAKTEYTYNGETQTINSGAYVTRDDELPSISYSNNTFKDVPQNGKLVIIITADETDNYKSASKLLEITVHKKNSNIVVNSNYEFIYTAQNVQPSYTIDNNEQVADFSNMPKYVGEYLDVELIVPESKNYNRAVAVISKIVVTKQETTLDLSQMQTSFVYNGNKQYINGARVTRNDEIPTIVYSIPWFINVPAGNVITVEIIAEETSNYKSASQTVTITIQKADSGFVVSDNVQKFTYSKDGQIPKYSINNTEQVIDISKMPVKVGEYYNIELIANESENYKQSKAIIEKVIIKKQQTIIDISNMQQEFTYNGQTQYIFGAKIARQDELVDVSYSASSFVNVPENGKLEVLIESPETENYLAGHQIATITINKAETIIDTDSMQKEYTYNGLLNKIEGAKVNRMSEAPTIVYSNNIFTDVPAGGELEVGITARETQNYRSTSTTVVIKINKAQGKISVPNINYVFTYNQKHVHIGDYTINNDEQMMVNVTMPKEVGDYNNFVLRTNESKNYLADEISINITIKPVILKIKIHDKSSVWMFGLEKLTYTILEGSVYEGDELGVKLMSSANPMTIGSFDINMEISNGNYELNIVNNGNYFINPFPQITTALIVAVLAVVMVLIIKQYKRKDKNLIHEAPSANTTQSTTQQEEYNVEELEKIIKELIKINKELVKPDVKEKLEE